MHWLAPRKLKQDLLPYHPTTASASPTMHASFPAGFLSPLHSTSPPASFLVQLPTLVQLSTLVLLAASSTPGVVCPTFIHMPQAYVATVFWTGGLYTRLLRSSLGLGTNPTSSTGQVCSNGDTIYFRGKVGG